ncbi:MAG: hypothetical protein HEQ39_09965 [Rhizobacter sp.]
MSDTKEVSLSPSGRLPMDPKSVAARHEKRKNWFLAEASRQAKNRSLMAKCEAYYDNNQWDSEDAETVRARGQNPVTYNEIKPTIDWLIGTERRTRVDFVVVAEDDGDEADEDARLKTKLLKYLDQTNRAQFERSYAAEQQFKAGLGWIEVGLRGDKSGPPIFIGHESWRNMLHDSQGSKRDPSDWRYVFRIKVVDMDVALAMFPDKKKEIEACKQTGDDTSMFMSWMGGNGLIAGLDSFMGGEIRDTDYLTSSPVDYFNPRERVMLIECWSREPMRNTEPGQHGIADPVTWKVMCSVMTENDTLIEAPSPFKHDLFPFIPVWAYRNSATGLPYGPIFQLMGPQESLNHRMSRSLHEASSNQVKIEEDAFNPEVMDLEELRAELDDPAGMAVFAKGALAGGKVQERPNQQEARFQLDFAQRDVMAIRQMSGVTGENRGLDTNSVSGKAVLAKQEQGSLLTLELFDNQLLARQLEGEMVLSLAEQFLTEPMTVRVAGEGNKFEYSRINEPQADGTYKNDITLRKAHFVIGEQAWKQSFAEAAFESLMQVLSQLASAAPQVVVAMLDVVFEMHPNLPRKQAILQRIRQVNGMTDPSGKMTPEQQAEHQQKQQVAAMQFQAQMAQLQADIREAQARGEKLEAEAMAKRLEALYTAAQGAQVLAAAPVITPIADELLRSAGYQDRGAQQPVLDNAPVQPQPVMQQAPQLQQADGMNAGIETPAADGVDPSLMQ